MEISRRKLFGFLAAAPIAAPILAAQAMTTPDPPPFMAIGDAVLGEVNLYAGAIEWVDPDYDERTGEVLRPIAMFDYQRHLS